MAKRCINCGPQGGAEEIGSGERLKDWQPTTYGDIHNFIRAAVARLTDIALADDPLSSRAKNLLGAHIRASITAPATCGRSASPDNVLVGMS